MAPGDTAPLLHAIHSNPPRPTPSAAACPPPHTLYPLACLSSQVLTLVLGHAGAGTTREVAQEVVASLAHVAAEAAGALPASPGPLLATLALAGAPPCRDVLASDPQAAYDLGMACTRLAGAAVPGSGGEAPRAWRLLAAAAMATASASVGHALAAARQGRMEWQQLAELAGAALGPACSLPTSPDTMAPVLEAAAEVRVCEGPFWEQRLAAPWCLVCSTLGMAPHA